MSLKSNKGAILEEVVLHLLGKIGYRIVKAGEEGTRAGSSGLEVQGRGEWHQIDALAAYDHTPPFMYPLRLLTEAKCYGFDSRGRIKKVGIEIVRNALGVLKDIEENYFALGGATAKELRGPRFNYLSALFSTSGYSVPAQNFALAHQIFLIQYEKNSLFAPIAETLRTMGEDDFTEDALAKKVGTKRVRAHVRSILSHESSEEETPFTEQGEEKFRENVLEPLKRIQGSYFGMLQGRWPIHLLSRTPLPPELFEGTDTLRCKIYGYQAERWEFVPSNRSRGEPGWFQLGFDLPVEIARLVKDAEGNRAETATIKQENFSFIALSGMIGGVRRQVKLELDKEWIEKYIERWSEKERDRSQ